MSSRTSTKLLTSKQVTESFGWKPRYDLKFDTIYNHLGTPPTPGFVELYEFADPAGKPIRCVFNGNGEVLYDPQHYAEYIRRQFM